MGVSEYTNKQWDLIVVGGGMTGVAAAVAARRLGLDVLILEKAGFLGGAAGTCLINPFMPYSTQVDGKRLLLSQGFFTELRAMLNEIGGYRQGQGENIHEEYLKIALDRLVRREKVSVLYHVMLAGVEKDGETIKSVSVASKAGTLKFSAHTFIDATGDADVLLRAGVPTVDGENFFTMVAYGTDLAHCKQAVEKNDVGLACVSYHGGNASLYGQYHPADMPKFPGASVEVVSDYLIQNQLKLFEKVKDQPRMERDVQYLPAEAQLRTTRHIDGDATLTMDDLYRHQETSIGAICDFDHRDRLFEVPFGTLVKHGFDNLLTCGRSASASGWGWDVLRVIPPAVLTGQAAGIAAALALDEQKPVYDAPVSAIQKVLADTGVIIHFDDAWVPTDQTADTFAQTEGHL